MSKSCVRLLISLDTLMDTRSGTLFRINPDAAAKVLKSRYYASRLWDNFPGFDTDVFSEVYKNRDKNVLKYSSLTNTIAIVHDFVQRVMNKVINSPVDMDAEIHINIFPYDLSEKEKTLIANSVTVKLPLAPRVSIVNYDLEYLNPLFIKNTYNTLVMYEFLDWLETHSRNKLIAEHTIPEVTIFAPALLRLKGDTPPENLVDQFTNMSVAMQPFVSVSFLPVDVFCSYLANKPKQLITPKGDETSQDNVDEEME